MSLESGAGFWRHIDEKRLWDRHQALARHGGLPDGGVNRQAFTPAEVEARMLLAAWAAELGLQTYVDAIGNYYVRRSGTDTSAAPVLMGSHIDTTPTGGKYDGAYGVLAALEVLQAMEESGVTTRHPLELVVWANEEGCRFGPGQMGAAVFCGSRKLEDVLGIRDAGEVSVEHELAAILAATPQAARRAGSMPVKAFLEAHIEQGPQLEAAGKTIGAVTGIQGRRSFRVHVTGEAGHAGTTPQSVRRDALLSAVDMIAALRETMCDSEDNARFTVGELRVTPNAPLVVPGKVVFTVDVRHPDDEVMARLGDKVALVCSANAGACSVEVHEYAYARSVTFQPSMIEMVERAADIVGLSRMRIPSYAGHDSRELAKVCPTAMIFVPSAGGVSHNAREHTSAADLAAGTRVLGVLAAELAGPA